jgi:hypothetical protein
MRSTADDLDLSLADLYRAQRVSIVLAVLTELDRISTRLCRVVISKLSSDVFLLLHKRCGPFLRPLSV